MEKWEDIKDLVFSRVFSWMDGKVEIWNFFLFGWGEKWEDRKYNLYKFTFIPLLDKKKIAHYIFIKSLYIYGHLIKKSNRWISTRAQNKWKKKEMKTKK